MQQHTHLARIRANSVDHFTALLVIRRIHVEEDRFAAGVTDLLLHRGGMRQCFAAVQMDSVDVVAGAGQLDRDRLTETAARSKYQRPFGSLHYHSATDPSR